MNLKAYPLRFTELLTRRTLPTLPTLPIPPTLPTESPESNQSILSEPVILLTSPILSSPPIYSSPEAIYQRYIQTRDIWYKAQAHANTRTNRAYRKAMGLPLRYSKVNYEWCLDFKEMGKRCGSRAWTKEEMMAYLDWSKQEDDRIEERVAIPMAVEGGNRRRGMRDIWNDVDQDIAEQEALYN